MILKYIVTGHHLVILVPKILKMKGIKILKNRVKEKDYLMNTW